MLLVFSMEIYLRMHSQYSITLTGKKEEGYGLQNRKYMEWLSFKKWRDKYI